MTRPRRSPELRLALELALSAGAILERYYGRLRRSAIHSKNDQSYNLVTRADLEAEALIMARIREKFPRHAILTEEAGAREGAAGDARWIVDPLDGTINFVHGFQFFAVSIGFEREGRIEAAVVHAPALGETFSAERGHGAFLGKRPIRVSETPKLSEALLATGFSYDRKDPRWDNRENYGRMLYASHGIRRAGSAAVDLAYVAAGRFDAFWELKLSPWDVAAGALLVSEAGGIVTDFEGGGDWLCGGNVVASNGRIHEALRTRLRFGRSPRKPGVSTSR